MVNIHDCLDLSDKPLVLGNHSIWDPAHCLKIPHQFGGRLTKRTRHESTYPRDSIVDEVCMLRALAEQHMAPPIGDVVFFRSVISDYPGTWHHDPCGAYGYEMADANSLPPGRFNVDAMRRLPIEGSEGAWADVAKKPDNVVNGYLVDVRRTGWDMLRWCGERWELPDGREDADALRTMVHRWCQFPSGSRTLAYQDFWLRGSQERGQRRVSERAELLLFDPKPNESVLDIGCQSGGFLQLAWYKTGGAGKFVGVDTDGVYIDCARALARSCGQNICFRHMDVVSQYDEFVAWVRAYFKDGIDHLLLLSMEKHIGERHLWRLMDELGARNTYVETNAVATDDGNGPVPDGPMKMWSDVQDRGGVHIGNSRDRNLRRLYRMPR